MEYLEWFEEVGVMFEVIDMVFCIYLYVDYVGWNIWFEGGCWVLIFENVCYFFGCVEWDYWKDLLEDEDIVIGDFVCLIVDWGLVDFVEFDVVFGDGF